MRWSEYDDGAARLASALTDHGLGHGSKVGMFMYNSPEYLITQYAAFKERMTPINVNYRYLEDELTYLLDNADCEAVVYHRSLSDRLARIRDRLPQLRWCVVVDDGGAPGGAEVDGAEAFETVLAEHPPAARRGRAGDDLYMLYTGGTTGMPKGVMYEMGPFTENFLGFVAAGMGRAPFMSEAEIAEVVAGLVVVRRATEGHPGVPADARNRDVAGFPDAPTVRERGRAARGPFVRRPRAVAGRRAARRQHPGDRRRRLRPPHAPGVAGRAAQGTGYDVSSVNVYISSGTMFSTEVIDGLLDFTPGALVVDALGSTEGAMAQKLSVKGALGTTASFAAMPSTKVFGPDDREVVPGSGEIGIVAVTGSSIPLGYYKDEAKTESTFRVIDGVRYGLPGDMARVELDGSITLLGRGSNCINTAGEKVYPEEVEEVVKTHPAVADCLVFGVDDERFGQRIIGVFSAISGNEAPSGDEVIAHAKAKLAGYKVPKQLVVVDVVPRSPNGKADYGAARDLVVG